MASQLDKSASWQLGRTDDFATMAPSTALSESQIFFEKPLKYRCKDDINGNANIFRESVAASRRIRLALIGLNMTEILLG